MTYITKIWYIKAPLHRMDDAIQSRETNSIYEINKTYSKRCKIKMMTKRKNLSQIQTLPSSIRSLFNTWCSKSDPNVSSL